MDSSSSSYSSWFLILLIIFVFPFVSPFLPCLETLEQQRLAAIGEGLIDPLDVGL